MRAGSDLRPGYEFTLLPRTADTRLQGIVFDQFWHSLLALKRDRKMQNQNSHFRFTFTILVDFRSADFIISQCLIMKILRDVYIILIITIILA